MNCKINSNKNLEELKTALQDCSVYRLTIKLAQNFYTDIKDELKELDIEKIVVDKM